MYVCVYVVFVVLYDIKFIHMYVCLYVCMYICIYANKTLSLCVYMYVCMYVCLAASKFAVEGLCSNLRIELAFWNVHVCNINPGFMRYVNCVCTAYCMCIMYV